MKPLTRDQSDVLKALASHGGGEKTLGELSTYSSRVDRMRTRRRDEALQSLEARGFAGRVRVRVPSMPHATVAGWAATAEGLVALQKEGVGA